MTAVYAVFVVFGLNSLTHQRTLHFLSDHNSLFVTFVVAFRVVSKNAMAFALRSVTRAVCFVVCHVRCCIQVCNEFGKYELCVFGSSELCVSVRISMSRGSRPGFGLAVTRCTPTALSNVVHVKGVGQHGRGVRGLHGSGVARREVGGGVKLGGLHFAGCCSLCSQVVAGLCRLWSGLCRSLQVAVRSQRQVVAVFAGLCSQVVAGLCKLWSGLCRSLQVAVRSQSQVVGTSEEYLYIYIHIHIYIYMHVAHNIYTHM